MVLIVFISSDVASIFPYPKLGMMNQSDARLLTKGKAPPGRGQRGSNTLQRFNAGDRLIPAPAPGAAKAITSQCLATLEEVSQDRHFHAKYFCSYRRKTQTKIQQFSASKARTPVLGVHCTTSHQHLQVLSPCSNAFFQAKHPLSGRINQRKGIKQAGE